MRFHRARAAASSVLSAAAARADGVKSRKSRVIMLMRLLFDSTERAAWFIGLKRLTARACIAETRESRELGA
jgi:hypothetical protein